MVDRFLLSFLLLENDHTFYQFDGKKLAGC